MAWPTRCWVLGSTNAHRERQLLVLSRAKYWQKTKKKQHLWFLVTSDKKLPSLIWHLWLLWHGPWQAAGVLWLRGGIMSVLVVSPFQSLVYMMQERWEMASYDCCGTKVMCSVMPAVHYYSILVGTDFCSSVCSGVAELRPAELLEIITKK